MKDALDVATDDPDLAGEISLLAELMVAVAHTHVSLDQAAIDAILLPAVDVNCFREIGARVYFTDG